MKGYITSLTRSFNVETPKQPTAVYTMYDFLSFKRLHVSNTNLQGTKLRKFSVPKHELLKILLN